MQVAVPNVLGLTQAAATTSMTAAGLTVGTVTMASSVAVPTGSVISESPTAGMSVTTGSAVNLTLSTGPTQVVVPNVVGHTQPAAATLITGAGLKVGTVIFGSSAVQTDRATVIGESPAAGMSVPAGSAVNLTVSCGSAPCYVYVANSGDGTLSSYSFNPSTGEMKALRLSPTLLLGSGLLNEVKIDPSGKFLYVASNINAIYAFTINSDGSLGSITGSRGIPGSPFPGGDGPVSLAFDSTGAYLYVSNMNGNSISAYSVNAVTGALTALAGSPYAVSGVNPVPTQIVRAGNYLYVTESGADSVDVFSIAAGTGELKEGVAGSPFATDTGPYGITVDPSGSVAYVANAGAAGAGSISAFTINSASGVLTPVAGNPQKIPVDQFLSIDPLGKFLFVTESAGVAVYPITAGTGVLGTAVTGSPFATGINAGPHSVGIDPSDRFVYVGNAKLANVAEFTFDSTTGVLTPVAGSPIAAGTFPDFIAID